MKDPKPNFETFGGDLMNFEGGFAVQIDGLEAMLEGGGVFHQDLFRYSDEGRLRKNNLAIVADTLESLDEHVPFGINLDEWSILKTPFT